MNINFINTLKSFYKKIVLRRQMKKLKATLKSMGVDNIIDPSSQFVNPNRITLGSYIYVGPRAYINGLGGVEIMSGTIIGPNITIHSANHNYYNSKYIPYDETFSFKKVLISENVWIGSHVIIVPGTEIGEGCIIGAGSVVSGKIPALSVVVGNPCKIIKSRDREHYNLLKNEEMIYLKHKIEKNLQPNFEFGYNG